jgi:Mycobacterium membrane protein
MALLAASLIAAPVAIANPGDTVTYSANSDAPLSFVTYYDGMNTMQQLHNPSSHWHLTFTSQAADAQFALTVQTTGQQVSCEINVNRSVRDQKSTAGRDTVATCGA